MSNKTNLCWILCCLLIGKKTPRTTNQHHRTPPASFLQRPPSDRHDLAAGLAQASVGGRVARRVRFFGADERGLDVRSVIWVGHLGGEPRSRVGSGSDRDGSSVFFPEIELRAGQTTVSATPQLFGMG